MKHISDDAFAMSNPAFCAMVLHYFLKGYHEVNSSGAEYPLAFLPIPLILSEDILSTMISSNRTTGFLNWITKNSLVKVGLHERVENTISMTKEAIIFGAGNGIFSFTDLGRLIPSGQIKDDDVKKVGLYKYASIAKRFGIWSGQLNSTETLLYSLGIRL